MTTEDLLTRLDRGLIIRLPILEWAALEGAFPLIEEHDTLLKGILVVRARPNGFLVVEEPAPGERAVRPLGTLEEVQRFVAERLVTHERMWNGCGCKVDYDR